MSRTKYPIVFFLGHNVLLLKIVGTALVYCQLVGINPRKYHVRRKFLSYSL